MPKQITQLAQTYMVTPHRIQIAPQQMTLKEIEQILVPVSDRTKFDTFCQLFEQHKPFLALVFCRTKRRASHLNAMLQERGLISDELHGDLSQAKREQVMKKFRTAKIEILVATDLAARGIDIEGISHVFNYDIPHDADSYIHRIGRTGRAGQTGIAITFASPHDKMYVDLIEQGIRSKIPKLLTNTKSKPVPNQEKPKMSRVASTEKKHPFRKGSDRPYPNNESTSHSKRKTSRSQPNSFQQVKNKNKPSFRKRGS
jgi:ATP-dependent RNA helicase DeaD